jgi:hypothetical protein
MTAPSPPPQGPQWSQGPQGPHGAQSPQGPTHFTPPPAQPVSQSSARSNLIIAGVLAGGGCLLVLLVVVALVAVFALRGGSGGGGGGGGAETESATPTASPEEQATALATEYTDALVAGDAETVLALVGAEELEDVQLLPAEAYAEALELAPVADVEIGAPVLEDGGLSDGIVPLSYTVGGESASTELSVHDYDDDGVLELTAAIPNTTAPDHADALSMTLNGAEVTAGQELLLLPGGYEVAFGLEHFAPDPLLVTASEGPDGWPSPVLTESGLSAFRGAVQKAVDDCIAKTSLAAGCGMQALSDTSTDGWTAVDGTVSRTLTDEAREAIEAMEAAPVGDDPAAVEGSSAVGAVPTTLECTKDGQSGECEMISGGTISVPTVDMTDPELPVTWS